MYSKAGLEDFELLLLGRALAIDKSKCFAFLTEQRQFLKPKLTITRTAMNINYVFKYVFPLYSFIRINRCFSFGGSTINFCNELFKCCMCVSVTSLQPLEL